MTRRPAVTCMFLLLGAVPTALGIGAPSAWAFLSEDRSGLAADSFTGQTNPRRRETRPMMTSASAKGKDPTPPGDWRAATLSRIRTLIEKADPDVVEEQRWRKSSNPDGVPVWSHHGMICTGETYKDHVKFTFAKGPSLDDPSHLFNSGLEGKARRAIDIHEGEEIDPEAFKDLFRAAVALNGSSKGR